MTAFPRTMVENLSLPRMLMGSNWILGYSHRSASADEMIRRRNADAAVIRDMVKVYLEAGIDAMMAPFINMDCLPEQVLMDGIHMAEDDCGHGVILIDTPVLDMNQDARAEDYNNRKLDAVQKNGASVCLIHHSSAERLVCKRTATIDGLENYTAAIRKRGMIPGLSAHMPELVLYSDAHPEYDVQTYIQIYNCMGFLMQIEVEGVRKIIENAKKPVMTIKSMAAGRCTPYVGLTFSYASLREQDMVTCGAFTPEEAREDIEIALAAIERRFPDLEGRSSPLKTAVLGGR